MTPLEDLLQAATAYAEASDTYDVHPDVENHDELILHEHRLGMAARAWLASNKVTSDIARCKQIMSGWQAYGWKDGQYIEDLQTYFDEAINHGS